MEVVGVFFVAMPDIILSTAVEAEVSSSAKATEDKQYDAAMRPKTLEEYVGQTAVKNALRIGLDAAKLRGELIEHVLIEGGPGLGKCITPDSIVFTEQGMVSIGSLGDLQKKGFQEKAVGIYGSNDVQSTSHFYNNGMSKTIRIKSHQGYELEGTPDHPIIVLERDGVKFKKLKNLQKRDIVAIGRGQNYFSKETHLPVQSNRFSARNNLSSQFLALNGYSHMSPHAAPALAATVGRSRMVELYQTEGKSAQQVASALQCSPGTIFNLLHYYSIPARSPYERLYETITLPTEMTPELARLCGYIIGDAYAGEMGEIAFSNEDEEILQDYSRVWRAMFNQGVHVQRWQHQCPVVRVKNKKIREFFKAIGIPYCTSHNKEIPWTILRSPKTVVAEFLRGYFECDGHIRPDCRQVDITSASKKLIQQLQVVLLNFGIISRRYDDVHKMIGRTYYRLYITGGDVDIFKQEIGFVSERKRNAQHNFRAEKNTNKDLVPYGKVHIKDIKRTLTSLTNNLLATCRDRTGKQQSSHGAMNACLQSIREALRSVSVQVRKAQEICTPYIFWDFIESIEEGRAQTVDVSIPTTHTFFANGFINHNTTLAYIIAHHMGSALRVTSGPAIERAGDLAAILTNLEPNSVLFIDECHRLPKTVEEILYPAMEDRALDLVIGKGPSARTLRIDLPPFTLVAATTRLSLLSSPLRDRFGHHFHIDRYCSDELVEILRRNSRRLGLSADEGALGIIASRSRGTPRVANRLLKRVRDIAQVEEITELDAQRMEQSLERLGIDPMGLAEIDRKLLEVLLTTFNGGPVGLQAWAAATAQEMSTIEEIYEPYLLQCGFVDRTARGRIATKKAYEHLGKKMPEQQQPLL